LYAPAEQFELPALGYGLTNAALRTTPGSGDLRRGDFDGERLAALARELRPRAIAFVGKEAYRGAFGERPELGPQLRSLEDTGLFVLPSTSPANAAVPYAERLRWFCALREWLEPEPRHAARAFVLDGARRVLLLRWQHPVTGDVWWITPGGRIDEGEDALAAIRRELVEEIGLDVDLGPVVWTREHVLLLSRRIVRQYETFFLVRVDSHEVSPTIDVVSEDIHGHRWWTLAELESTSERIAPPQLAELVRSL
jgi:8-oxo-dGTP pyrophosphatase MutT (NUDIX family)